MSTGCGCARNCYQRFSADYVSTFRLHCLELTSQELDLAVLGQMSAFVNTSSSTSDDSHVVRMRKNTYSTYYHQCKQVCSSMFGFLFTVGKKRMRNLTEHYLCNGLTARVHGNSRRTPHHALSFESIENVVKFLFMYAEQNALLLPGRVPGYSRTDLKLLPSSTSKRGILGSVQCSFREQQYLHSSILHLLQALENSHSLYNLDEANASKIVPLSCVLRINLILRSQTPLELQKNTF